MYNYSWEYEKKRQYPEGHAFYFLNSNYGTYVLFKTNKETGLKEWVQRNNNMKRTPEHDARMEKLVEYWDIEGNA